MENRRDVPGGGYVELLDHMGSDHSIANSARVCTSAEDKNDPAADRKLIRYMLRHGHTSPFEMAEVQFLVHVPMGVWRQWIRHRTASVNEVSSRYTELPGEYFVTDADGWRRQSDSNRQGSDGCIDEVVGADLTRAERELLLHAEQVYRDRLEAGVAREQARKDLPLSIYTKAVWKIDLNNLMKFLKQRMHPHAQLEIRQYAEAVYGLAAELFPETMEAFRDYVLDTVTLSAIDLKALRTAPSEPEAAAMCLYESEREYQEYLEKRRRMGLI